MKLGKTVMAALALVVGASAFVPMTAQAQPHHRKHKVCHFDRHHHRQCHWVR
jgi:hypothetical protein